MVTTTTCAGYSFIITPVGREWGWSLRDGRGAIDSGTAPSYAKARWDALQCAIDHAKETMERLKRAQDEVTT